MDIKGVTHPIPTEFAERIYNKGKNVVVIKSYLGKVSEGDKFVLYESWGAKAYTGWADIKFIQKMESKNIIEKFGSKLIITEKEFREYSKDRKIMTVIEIINFEKFNKPVKPKLFVSLSGKYIYGNEFKMIKNKKD